MQPYQIINYILEKILVDCMKVDVSHYVFKNSVRWMEQDNDDRFDNYGNLTLSKFFNINVGERYYDANKKTWRAFEDYDRIYATAIDHSFEPVMYDLDYTLWDPAFREKHFWPMYEDPADPTTFIEIKDLPCLVLHSEHYSDDITKLQDLGYKTVHWFSHAFLCSEYYFKMYSNLDIVKNYKARPIEHTWICANRLLRQHRTDFLEMLDLDRGCYSLLNPDPNGLTYNGPVPTRSFDDHTNSSAEIDFTKLTPWNTSFLHIVSETVWQEKIHFTEKVFKPMVLHQPFVVLQAPGSLAYLRSYGFETFGAWWDESYDTIDDPTERMQAIADIVNSIGAKSLEELETMRMEMASVLEHNFRHFYENIPAICLDELRKGIATL